MQNHRIYFQLGFLVSAIVISSLSHQTTCFPVFAYEPIDHSRTHPLRITIEELLTSTTYRGIDNVGPALANATQSAIDHGKAILSNYTTVLHGIAIPAGLAVSFFGYFLLAPVLFLAAFITGGGACFVAVNTVIEEETPTEAWIAIGAMLLGGALLGFIAMRALPIGMFAVGASLGVVFAASLRSTVITDLFPKDPRTAFIVIAVVIGLILGLLAVFFEKQMLVFSTAYAGGFAFAFGIGHFAGHFPTADDISNAEKGNVNVWTVVYILGALVVGSIGMVFQFWLARDRPMPEYAPYDRRRRRRRVRRTEPDDWSDDDWEGDVYVERVPLPPRRKREFAPRHSDQRPPSDQVYVENARRSGGASAPLPIEWNTLPSAAQFEHSSTKNDYIPPEPDHSSSTQTQLVLPKAYDYTGDGNPDPANNVNYNFSQTSLHPNGGLETTNAFHGKIENDEWEDGDWVANSVRKDSKQSPTAPDGLKRKTEEDNSPTALTDIFMGNESDMVTVQV